MFKTKKSQVRIRSTHFGALMLAAGVIVGIAIGGIGGVIAASSTSSKIVACANKTTGAMRYSKSGRCTKTESKVSWNLAGTNGTAGAKGETGAAGTNGTAGAKGETGAAGAKGDTGTAGTNGALTNSQTKNICGVNGLTACVVGLQGPGGGIVFMTPSTAGNTSGLFYEAAPSTWSSPSDPTSAWCNESATLLGFATGTGTGAMDGANKTAVMLGVCTSGAANLADVYAATVSGVVYGDWFLPSKGELKQMYENRTVIGGFAAGRYWSSSEYNADFAWYQYFGFGFQDYGAKFDGVAYVRPVRAF